MKQLWIRSVIPISALFSFRMLGLFMLIPVFSVYAVNLAHATPTLIGIALGSYGLSQGLLQIPFGMLSDRYGRKPIITIGLIFFLVGSLLGGAAHSIYTMIIARILQGFGAIGSVLVALLADLTPDEHRTKAMALIGTTIGLSFTVALIISPIVSASHGLAGIFYITSALAVLGILLVYLVIPTPSKEPFHTDSHVRVKDLTIVLKHIHLFRLNVGIFCQHFILTSTFFIIPILLHQFIVQGNLTTPWLFYLPIMIIAFLFMIPIIIFAEKKQKIKQVFVTCVAVTAIVQLLFFFSFQYWTFVILFLLYFISFNILEASLPSLASRQAPTKVKGTAMGVYSSSQFLGIFFGGSAAGLTYQLTGNHGIFLINALVSLTWFYISLKMLPNVYQLTIIIKHSNSLDNITAIKSQLNSLRGVNDVAYSSGEGLFYLKVTKSEYIEGSADKLITQQSHKREPS